MKTKTTSKHTSVTFNVVAFGNTSVLRFNEIVAVCRKHNAQDNIFENASPFKYDKHGNFIGFKMGNFGGTVTFHSHTCNHAVAAAELVALLTSFGLVLKTKEIEVIRTIRIKDGTPYKCENTFIYELKRLNPSIMIG